jgi:Undecaprenyl-phosphate glucose phosphotransferase
MAEPDIAIDIISSASRASDARDGAAGAFRRRPSLARRTLALAGLDAAVTACLAMVCYALFNPVAELASPRVIVPTALLVAAVAGSFLERGLYAAPLVVSAQLNGRKIALAWVQAVATGTLVAFCAAAIAGGNWLPDDLDGMTATLRGAWLPVFLVAGLSGVVTARSVRIRALAAPEPLNRTVIIGDAESIHDLVLRLRTGGSRAFDLVGVVEHAEAPTLPAAPRASLLGLPLFDGLNALERMIRMDAVDTVLVALPWSCADQARSIIHRISMAPIDVYVYQGMHSLKLPLRRASKSFELPLLMVCNRPIDGWRAALKRTEDLVLSVGLLLAVLPVMLACAAAVKLTSKGPVFFRQRRLGYNNRVIEVLKFRSMYAHLSDADAAQQTSRGDKRVTRVGAFLRKTSLDELPQLLNVLKGDMSLVGPRPHALATTAGGLALEEAVPVYPSRHRVKPGITGWAQVNGYRGALDSVEKIVHRVNYDLYYIENWSLGLDIKILCKTVRLVFADDKAF